MSWVCSDVSSVWRRCTVWAVVLSVVQLKVLVLWDQSLGRGVWIGEEKRYVVLKGQKHNTKRNAVVCENQRAGKGVGLIFGSGPISTL